MNTATHGAITAPRERRGIRAVDRLAAHVNAASLDRELASGVAAWRSPAHAARARQLTSRRTRHGLAGSLERLVQDAERPPEPFHGAVVRPCRPQVWEARPELLSVAHRLRGSDPVDARGIAQIKALLCDGAGPCYVESRPGSLKQRLEVVDQWLEAPA